MNGMINEANPEPTLYDILLAVNHVSIDVGEVKTEVHELNRRTGNLEVTVLSIDERLENLEKAFDRDAVAIVDHERRITKLETIRV